MALVRSLTNGFEWDVPDAIASGLVASGDVEYVDAPEAPAEPALEPITDKPAKK